MKKKLAILTLTACSIALLPAQTAAPEKPAVKKEEKAEEPKAETPVEKQAFKMFALFSDLPAVFGSIKDDATLTAAETKIEEMFKKMKTEKDNLLKLEVPSNEARKKLAAKMKIKEQAMNKKMQAAMMGIAEIDPAIREKLQAMMMKFGGHMAELEPTMTKYFEPDEEKEPNK